MYMPESNSKKKKELYKGIEEAMNNRVLMSSKISVCTYRSVFEEKSKQSNDKNTVKTKKECEEN